MIIDELVSVLGWEIQGEENLTKFRDGMARAQKGLEAFAQKVALVARRITLGLSAFAASAKTIVMGAFAFTTSQARELASLGDVADRLGVNVERLQELRHAASMTGMDEGSFDNAFRRLIRRSAEAAKGTGAAKNAFKELGISLKDNEGRLKAGEDLLLEVADAMTKVKDHGDAMRLGFQMFDTDAAKLMPMMLRGSEGIRELFEDARKRGLVFDQQDIDKARAYTDQMDLFQKSLAALRKTVALDLMPVLTEFLGTMTNWYTSNRSIGDSIGKAMEVAVESSLRFLRGMASIGERIGKVLRYLSGDGINLSTWQALAGLGALLLRIFSPFTFWLGAAYLILDEIFAYMEGADSYLGDFIYWIQEATGASEGWAQVLAGVAGALGLLMIARPTWFLRWLWRLLPAAAKAGVVTALATAIRGLATSLVALAGAGTAVGSSGILGLLGRLGLIGAGAAGVAAGGAYIVGRLSEDNAKEARQLATHRDAERDSMEAWRRYRDSGDYADDMDEIRHNRPSKPSTTIEKMLEGMRNFSGWMDHISPQGAAATAASTVHDNRDQSVNVGSPNVTVNVQQPVEAPAELGRRLGNATNETLAPLGRRVTGN